MYIEELHSSHASPGASIVILMSQLNKIIGECARKLRRAI
jgi:hypothetical protein